MRDFNSKLKEIRGSGKVLALSDKTGNVYPMEPRTYDALLKREMNRRYRAVDRFFFIQFKFEI